MANASIAGGAGGFILDRLLGTFPLGTAAGTFHQKIFQFLSGDLDRAYDPARATQGSRTADFGDLKGMATGLFGDLKAAFSGEPRAEPKSPQDAAAMGRPYVNDQVRTEAQSKTGLGGWGKALLWGGGILAGLHLLRNMQMPFGGFGMPFYGGMSPLNMMGPAMMPGMTGPGMMPGMFW